MARRSGRWLAALGGGALLLGCGSGLVRLDAKKVRSVSLVLVEGRDTVCPTAPLLAEVVAVIGLDDGKVLETRTPGNDDGKVRTSDLEWTADVGVIDENGIWTLPWDLLPWHDRTLVVRASVPTRPELTSELRVTPRFDCGGVADFGGLDGHDGSSGGDAEAGGRRPGLEVALAYVDTTLNQRLVLVRVIDHDLGRRDYYLVDPRSPKRLVIAADGGDGGNGGPGGGGSNGSSGTRGPDGATGGMCENGYDGAPGTDGQAGTDGTPGGRGGDGGNGGAVTITYPAAFPELANAVDITVEGGAAGAGGAGGRGGQGGQGGAGGNGGSAGPTSDPSRACTTESGSNGREGARGPDGRDGSTGAPGRPGAPGVISTATERIDKLFAFELARGWKIVRDDAAAGAAGH